MDDYNPINSSDLEVITSSATAIVTAVFSFITVGAVILAIILAYRFFTATDDTKRKNAKMQLIYAIIGVIALIIFTIIAPNITKRLVEIATSTTNA